MSALHFERAVLRCPRIEREQRRLVETPPSVRLARPVCPACGTPMLFIGRGEYHCRAELTIYQREDGLTWRLVRR